MNMDMNVNTDTLVLIIDWVAPRLVVLMLVFLLGVSWWLIPLMAVLER